MDDNKKKDSVIFYISHFAGYEYLDDQTLGRLFRLVMQFARGEEVEVPGDLRMAYNFITIQMAKDDEKYQRIIEKRRKAGGSHKGNQHTPQNGTNGASVPNLEQTEQTGTNGTDNVNGNVNGNVNDFSNEKDIVGGEGGARTHAPEGAPTPDPNANAGGEENPEGGKTAETPQGNPQTPPQDPPKPPTIEERKLAFGQSLVPFVGQYGASLIRDFYEYWTEPNQSKTRLKFEMEKTWDTSRRLRTWVRREDEYAKEKTSGGKGGGYAKPKKENPIDTFNSVFGGGSDDELKQEAEVAIWTEVL